MSNEQKQPIKGRVLSPEMLELIDTHSEIISKYKSKIFSLEVKIEIQNETIAELSYKLREEKEKNSK